MVRYSRSGAWSDIVDSMMHCKACLSYSSKPFAVVRAPPQTFRPPNPRGGLFKGGIKVLFVSEAPPGGLHYGHFFWSDEGRRDGLRSQLLKACKEASLIPETNLRSFVSAGFYLMPTVPAATERMSRYNENPSAALLKHSATEHLRKVMDYIRPERVFLLGESALDGAYHALREGSTAFQSDFESSGSPLRDILRSRSPYTMRVNWGAFELYCSYWPRNGQNFRKTVEDLRALRKRLGARG